MLAVGVQTATRFFRLLSWSSVCSSLYFPLRVRAMSHLVESYYFCNCTYLLTPWSTVLLEKLTVSQLIKKFPAFYGTRSSITAFTRARHLFLYSISSIQSIPSHQTNWSSILILFSHLCLGLPSGLFPSGFPNKTLYTPLLSPILATCPAHFILLDLITQDYLVRSTDH